MIDLAVIMVTWNVRELIIEALDSLLMDLRASGLTYRVIVVDSASGDGTPQVIAGRFPHEVELIASADNLGFAGGNNVALRRLGFDPAAPMGAELLPRAVYLLNPDTITRSGATRALYDALMADARIGVTGARLVYGDGSFQHGAFGFPGLRQLWVELFPTPGRLIERRFNGRYPRYWYERSAPFAVDFTLGATMMLKREAIQQTGIFDERFFMYCEEVDWAWRIRRAGWEIVCVPQALVVHLGGQSTGQVRARSFINLWTSRLMLFDKHYPGWKRWVARRMVAAGMRRKLAQAGADTPPDVMDAYRQIQRLAEG